MNESLMKGKMALGTIFIVAGKVILICAVGNYNYVHSIGREIFLANLFLILTKGILEICFFPTFLQ